MCRGVIDFGLQQLAARAQKLSTDMSNKRPREDELERQAKFARFLSGEKQAFSSEDEEEDFIDEDTSGFDPETAEAYKAVHEQLRSAISMLSFVQVH